MTVTTDSSQESALLGGLARGSTANLLGAAVFAVANLGATIVVARGMDQATAGVFFSATSLFLVAIAVGQLGTDIGLVYFLSRVRSLGRPDARRWLYKTATRPVMVIAIGIGLGIFVFSPQISELINPDNVSVSTRFLRGIALFLPLAALENVTLAGTRGLGTMRANVITEQIGRPVLQLLLVLATVTLTDGSALGVAWAFAYLPAALLAIWYWRRIGARVERWLANRTPAPAADKAAANISRNEFWRFTAPRAAATIAQVAMQRLDIVLVAALAGAVPAAIYTAATRFLVLGQMGQRAISLAVQPLLAEALAVADTARASRLYRVSTSWLMLVTWPIYLLFIFFGGTILNLFGSGYTSGRSVLVLLSLTMLLATGCGMVDMVLVMAGRSSWSLANLMVSLGLQVGIDVWLIPDHGFYGAAIGWSVAIIAANLIPLTQVAIVLGLHPFGRSTALSLVVLLGCFGVVPAVARLTVGDGWRAMVLSMVVGGGIYLFLLWKLRNELSLTMLASIRRRRGRGGPPAPTSEAGPRPPQGPGDGSRDLAASQAAVATLWPAPAGLRFTWSPRGAGTPYLALPSTNAPRLLIPVRVTGSDKSLNRFAGSRRTRIVRKVLRTALKRRAARWLPLPRLRVVPDPDGIENHLRRVLKRPAEFAVLLGPPRANLKPVLQIFGTAGRTIAFAKVATNPLTERLLATETSALRVLATKSLPGIKVAEIIDYSSWRGSSVLVQTVLRHSDPSRRPTALPAQALAVIARSTGTEHHKLGDSEFWRELSTMSSDEWHGIDVSAFDRLRSAIPSDTVLELGAWHGDFSPWNASWSQSELEVWDWERFQTGVPIGMDAAHWRMNHEMGERFEAGTAWSRMLEDVGEVERRADCDESHADLVTACYVLTAWRRYHDDATEAVSPSLRARVTRLAQIADVATHQLQGTRGRVRS